MKRYDLTEDGYRRKFLSCKPAEGESPDMFIMRIVTYLDRWIELSRTEKSYQKLKDLIVREQFMDACPEDLAIYAISSIFSDRHGTVSTEEHRIELTSSTPVRQRPYAVPYAMEQTLRDELRKMEVLEIIRKSSSHYSSPFSHGFCDNGLSLRILKDAFWNELWSYADPCREDVAVRNGVDYIDDLLVHTETWEADVETLAELFRQFREANGSSTIDFLGHRLGQGTISLRDENVEKVRNAPRPKTKKKVRAFLGLVGYYKDFVPNFAAISARLSDLVRKGQPNTVNWGDSQEKAYNSLKFAVTSKPVLQLPHDQGTRPKQCPTSLHSD
ncbi:LOW QUALITY PROTEIN: Pol polyprotein [Elysia marginata]|uniref:Pol polyprotein n=1 Tax=Elysia marginata TaxID=1093978 RepID=A0AAV4F3S2_9GAST|nr:LOW QUALITY PROTEIN: Pol polyprotein [Elysia marginata]